MILSHSRDDERQPAPSSAGIRELREEMVMVKGQLGELKQMMRVSFDLQLDIQRAIRQEVAAALTAFLSQQPPVASGGGHPLPATCPIPTLGINSCVCLLDCGICVCILPSSSGAGPRGPLHSQQRQWDQGTCSRVRTLCHLLGRGY